MPSNSSLPLSDYLPIPNPTSSFWQDETLELHNHCTTDAIPASSDIVIIGAGYAGISTAYHLLKDDPREEKLSITILEARGVCSGATGRNGGHLRPDMHGHIPKYMDRAGVEAGIEVAEFEIAHLYAMKEIIEAEKIDCDFSLTRTVDIWINEKAAIKAKEVYDLMVSRNLAYMKDVYFVMGKDAEGVSGVRGAKACATYTAGTLWPYKFVLHLTKLILESKLVNIQTHTPATNVSPDPTGGFIVTTARGSVHAKKVIYANNAYVAGLLPQYSKAIMPSKGICCHISVPEGQRAPLLNMSYTIREEDSALSYLVPRADGSIVVGGANSKYRPYLEKWYNNVDDGSLIDTVEHHFDNYMQQFFYGWEDSGAKVDKIWTGVMGYSWDSNPHIGLVPETKDQYILAGFNGHGMPVIWLAAKGVAKMILEGVEFKNTGMPRLFETTKARIEKSQEGPEGGDILAVN